jgi:catechol 2,3-dioxygenase-like lactoylglutathione lyase family enzyme
MEERWNLVSLIEHIGITVADMDRTIEFYKKLGFELRGGPPHDRPTGGGQVAHMRKGQTEFEFFCPPREGETVGLDHIGFTVEHLDDVYEDLSKQGFQFTRGRGGRPDKPRSGGPGAGGPRRVVFLTDPDGVVLQLVETL